VITILFLAAEPTDLARIRVAQEVREIEDKLERSRLKGQFKLEKVFAARAQDVSRAMHELHPQIVHFSGHSTTKGELCFEDDAGEMRPASPDGLAMLFEQFPDEVSGVVLNACHTLPQAKAVGPHVGYVTGTPKAILDTAALAFSRGFYEALGYGRAIPEAFKLACAQVKMEGWDQTLPFLLGTGKPPLDTRPVSHIPIIIAVGCLKEEFQGMVRDAHDAMKPYDPAEPAYRSLHEDDYCIYQSEWLKPDVKDWKDVVMRLRRLIAGLHRRVPAPVVYHFFIRSSMSLPIGLGAILGAKQEVILHHHQKGSVNPYVPVIDLSGGGEQYEAARIIRTPAREKPQYISAQGLENAKGKIFVSIALAERKPTGVDKLARAARARLVEIQPKFDGTIPKDADWRRLAREVNTVLLSLVGGGRCEEMHLFPAAPVPIAFATGIGLDTRSRVFVHQWYAPDSAYHEVLRLHELGMP
jgi:hypothetical protein